MVSIVEDEHGNVDKLAVYNQGDSSILSGAPEGCIVAVKEPYYIHNGGDRDYMICVDHPSDVILLRFNDPIIPEPLQLGPLLKSEQEWRTAGDQAFLERDYPTAVFCYAEAAEMCQDDKSKAAIHAKRAGTNLLLGRYDEAKKDALASLTGGGKADWRAYYNAAVASYGLCEYKVCKEYLEEALKLNPDGNGVKREYERVKQRLHEEETGEYDFAAMFASLSPSHVHLDHGSFLKNTRVAKSPLHGYGLFATRAMKAGDLVFVEKATLMPNQYEPSRASAALYALMVRQLCDNPSLANTVLKLHPGDNYARTGVEGTIVDGVPVVDIFMVEGIRTKNCFSCPLSTLEDTKPSNKEEGKQAKGLWVNASFMNHSCVPNTLRSFLGDLMISRATRDIAEGEEISQQYVPVRPLVDIRNAQFRDGWGFECQCRFCESERQSPRDRLDKRKETVKAIEKLCSKHKNPSRPGVIIPDAAIRSVSKLNRQLEELHEDEVYRDLPRLTLINSCAWLADAHRGRKNYAKVVKYAIKTLRNFGYVGSVPSSSSSSSQEDGCEEVDWDPRELWNIKAGKTSFMTIHVTTALRRMADAYRALGKEEMAGRCMEAANFGYMLVTGFENDVGVLDA